MGYSATTAFKNVFSGVNLLCLQFRYTFTGFACKCSYSFIDPISLVFSPNKLRFNYFVKTKKRATIMNVGES